MLTEKAPRSTLSVIALTITLLLLIVALLGAGAVSRADNIHNDIMKANEVFHETAENLELVRADLDAARIHVRDYIIDPLAVSAEHKRPQFLQLKKAIDSHLDSLERLIGVEEGSAIVSLRADIDEYFNSIEPILAANPRTFPGGVAQIRAQMASRRDAAAEVAGNIAAINSRNLMHARSDIDAARTSLARYLRGLTILGLALGLVVAFVAIRYIRLLEAREGSYRLMMIQNEKDLRRLSNENLIAHEDERRILSRELHDEVGQVLTALGLEIGNIQKLMGQTTAACEEHIADAKGLVQMALKTVRNLAMGLRPSLLDDSGLVPALRWQIREFAKRTSVPVSFDVEGNLDDLPDNINTCVYRVTQEALSNCARYAQARRIQVALAGRPGSVSLAIKDDGVGFDPTRRSMGLGIVGIEERVRELHGRVTVTTGLQRGTSLEVHIPRVGELDG